MSTSFEYHLSSVWFDFEEAGFGRWPISGSRCLLDFSAHGMTSGMIPLTFAEVCISFHAAYKDIVKIGHRQNLTNYQPHNNYFNMFRNVIQLWPYRY